MFKMKIYFLLLFWLWRTLLKEKSWKRWSLELNNLTIGVTFSDSVIHSIIDSVDLFLINKFNKNTIENKHINIKRNPIFDPNIVHFCPEKFDKYPFIVKYLAANKLFNLFSNLSIRSFFNIIIFWLFFLTESHLRVRIFI